MDADVIVVGAELAGLVAVRLCILTRKTLGGVEGT